MEKQKERLDVLTEMTRSIATVGEKLNQMCEQNEYGELSPALYDEYKTELNNYIELNGRLKELTDDIDSSDKSDLQSQPVLGAYPGDHSPKD
jgi:hypothetical protein